MKITTEITQQALERLRQGASLKQIRESLGLSNNHGLRRELRKLAGPDVYAALIKSAKRPRSPVA